MSFMPPQRRRRSHVTVARYGSSMAADPVVEPEVARQIEELGAWAFDGPGPAVAARFLAQHRLPADPASVDDVVAETVIRVLRRLHSKGPLEVEGDFAEAGRSSVFAYANRALRSVVVDTLRAGR